MSVKPTSITLADGDRAWLRQKAVERSCSVSAVVRWLIRREAATRSTRRATIERQTAGLIQEIQRTDEGSLIERAALRRRLGDLERELAGITLEDK